MLLLWLLAAQGCMKFRISDKKAKRKFEEAGVTLSVNTISVNGRNLHYAQTGNDDKPTIVFLHGSPGAWNAFIKYMQDKDLLKRFRMVSVDRPGFGYSDFGDAIDLKDQADLISALLKRVKNKKPIYLVGHSLGGPLCVLLAAEYPQYVDGLVLLAASVDPNEEKPEKWRPVMKVFPLKYFLPGAFRPSNIELLAFKQDVLLMEEALQQVRVPVIIMHGKKDGMVPPENAAYASKYLKNAEVETVILPNANHFIPWTKYDTVKKTLISLLH